MGPRATTWRINMSKVPCGRSDLAEVMNTSYFYIYIMICRSARPLLLHVFDNSDASRGHLAVLRTGSTTRTDGSDDRAVHDDGEAAFDGSRAGEFHNYAAAARDGFFQSLRGTLEVNRCNRLCLS